MAGLLSAVLWASSNGAIYAADPALTATGTSGTAIVPSPVTSTFPVFSGMGGGITWEQLPGGSAPNAVLITRFHPNM